MAFSTYVTPTQIPSSIVVTGTALPTLSCSVSGARDGSISNAIGVGDVNKNTWPTILRCCNGKPITIFEQESGCTAWCNPTGTLDDLRSCFYEPDGENIPGIVHYQIDGVVTNTHPTGSTWVLPPWSYSSTATSTITTTTSSTSTATTTNSASASASVSAQASTSAKSDGIRSVQPDGISKAGIIVAAMTLSSLAMAIWL